MADDPTPDRQSDPAPDPDPTPDPKIDEPFDKDRALDTIRKQRESEAAAVRRAKDLEAKVKEYEDASKSDQDKLTERATGAEKEAADARRDAARLRVALKKGLTETQARRLVGDDEEALENDADELLASFQTEEKEDPPRRPRERLRAGAVPDVESEDAEPGLPRLMRAYAEK